MAKRARGGTGRPGQRRATQRSGPRPAGSTSPTSAASPTQATAGAVAADAVVSAPAPAPKVAPRARLRTASGASDAFVAEEALEYRYVVADVRRIVVVAAGMFGVMAVLFVLIDLTGAVHL
jgi:hypothetical protein